MQTTLTFYAPHTQRQALRSQLERFVKYFGAERVRENYEFIYDFILNKIEQIKNFRANTQVKITKEEDDAINARFLYNEIG